MSYEWDFSVFLPYAGAIFRGLFVTIQLSVYSTIIGTICGFLLGLLLRIEIIGSLLSIVNDMLRAVPMLILILFFYYFPYNQVFGITAPSAFVASLAALTLAQANFTAEIVRTSIASVSSDKIDSAKALGLRENAIWWYIVFPDVFRNSLPTLIAFFIGNVKLSSLASVIGTEELVYVARIAVGQTFRTLEAWVIVAGVYIVLVMPLVVFARQIEQSKWMMRR